MVRSWSGHGQVTVTDRNAQGEASWAEGVRKEDRFMSLAGPVTLAGFRRGYHNDFEEYGDAHVDKD